MARQSAWITCASCGKEAYADKDYGLCDPCAVKPENQPVWTYNPDAGESIRQLQSVDELEQAVRQMRAAMAASAQASFDRIIFNDTNWRSYFGDPSS